MMEKFVRFYVRVTPEIFLAVREGLGDVVAEFQLHRIGPRYKRPAEIRFPGFEHGAKIQKDDVVLTDDQVGWILVIGRQGVASGAHDALVPVRGDTEHLLSETVDIFIDASFRHAGTDDSLRFDRAKKLIGLLLSFQQRGATWISQRSYFCQMNSSHPSPVSARPHSNESLRIPEWVAAPI